MGQPMYDAEGNPIDTSQYTSALGQQISSNLGTQLQDAFSSGNVFTSGDSGLLRVPGGRNRYGEVRPDYLLMQEEVGKLGGQFTEEMGPAYQALSQKAMTEGDTRAAELARQQQGMMTQRARDLAQARNQSSLASARGQLAARGGLRSGAAERLAGQGQRGLMRVGQDIAAQDAAANLQISLADEATKNRMLGQVGNVEQQLGASNINRLERDLARLNTQKMAQYSEDMSALAAQQTAAGQAAAACFLAGTMVDLTNNRECAIEKLDLGMDCLLGGEVYNVSKSIVDHYYNYCGVSVTGSHAVLEDGKWIRVRDSKLAVPVYKEAVVFCVANKNHRLQIKGITFADLHEHDEYDHHTEEKLLEMLNQEEAE